MKNGFVRRFITGTVISGITFSTLFFSNTIKSKAETPWPEDMEISAEAAYVMDLDSGTVLYEKNADQKEHPASITKILTGLIAVENCSLDETVTFSYDAVFENESRSSSHIARDVGEEMSMENCLYGMMLASANECADAIAEHVGGTKEHFVQMMNEKAKELGCTNSNFACTNGLEDENHVTTAHDMALIARAAYQNETMAKIMGTGRYTIPPTNKHDVPTELINHHEMLFGYRTTKYRYEYCKGGKTGYTDNAHFTLVTYAEKEGKNLLCVILNEQMKNMHFTETTNLFEHYFDAITEHSADEVLNLQDKKVLKSLDKDLKAKNASMDQATITLPLGADVSDVKYEYTENRKPDSKTGEIGKVVFTYGKKNVGETRIYDKSRIKKNAEKITEEEKQEEALDMGFILRVLGIVLLICLVLAALYFANRKFEIFNRDKMKKRLRGIKKTQRNRDMGFIGKPNRKKRDKRFGKDKEEPLWRAWNNGKLDKRH